MGEGASGPPSDAGWGHTAYSSLPLHGNRGPLRGGPGRVLHGLGEDGDEKKEDVKVEVPSRRGQRLEFLDHKCPADWPDRFRLWTHNTSYIAQSSRADYRAAYGLGVGRKYR